MNIRYITIERQFGSGGSRIARAVAERCGIACYGREIMEAVAAKEQVPIESLEDYEESVSGSLLYSMFVMSQSQTGDPDLLSQEAKLYVAETRVIRELAKSGPAVFVGHCASQALDRDQGVLRVYIHGEEEDKQRRIVEDYGIAEKDVAAACRHYNRKRASYYGFCTRKKWADLRNYDVVLNSSTLGLEGCVRALTTLYGPVSAG